VEDATAIVDGDVVCASWKVLLVGAVVVSESELALFCRDVRSVG